jgi:predicted flap endonuclease-1-like 5' DNA nuclease
MNSIGTPGEVTEPRKPQKYISPTEALNVAQEMAKPIETPPTPTEIPPEELKAPTAHLTDVKGIGPKWSSELTEAGIPDIQTLADTNPQDLADQLEIPLERAQDWIDQAKDLK